MFMTASNQPEVLVERVVARTPRHMAARLRGLSDRGIAWFFITPTIVLLLAINVFPLIWAIRLSFTSFMSNLPRPMRFIGLENYSDILTDDDVWEHLQVTAHFVVSTIALQVLIGLGLA